MLHISTHWPKISPLSSFSGEKSSPMANMRPLLQKIQYKAENERIPPAFAKLYPRHRSRLFNSVKRFLSSCHTLSKFLTMAQTSNIDNFSQFLTHLVKFSTVDTLNTLVSGIYQNRSIFMPISGLM